MTIEYAQIVSTMDQRPDTTEPMPIFMDHSEQISGIDHSLEHPADIRINESGVYVIIAAPQVGRTKGNGPASVDFWLRKTVKTSQTLLYGVQLGEMITRMSW